MKRIIRPVLYLLFVFCLCVSCRTKFEHLDPENNAYSLTTERQLKDPAYVQRIEELYDGGQEGYFKGRQDVSIYYKIFHQTEPDIGAIVISSGRTEAAIKYKELIYDLFRLGYSVYIMDHRGQGLSGRMNKDPDLGYVEDFQYYIDDLKSFFEFYVVPSGHQNRYLLAHSMGGAIGVSYLQQFPEDFSAAAFSSPMLGLKTGICAGARTLAPDGPTYGPGEGKYNNDKIPFEKNTLTGSEVRYNRMIAAFEKVPKARLGGASYQWVVKSCDQFHYINNNLDKITTPLILFSAENEKIVSLKAHQVFIDKLQSMGKDCKAFLIERAMHELLIEKDEQRIEILNNLLVFYEQHAM